MSERLRLCCVCRKLLPKKDMIRVVKTKDGHIFLDETGKADGRGAYICKGKECAEKLKKTKAFNRAFKCQVNEKIYEEILRRFDDRKE